MTKKLYIVTFWRKMLFASKFSALLFRVAVMSYETGTNISRRAGLITGWDDGGTV
jgi:hypothetical protein